MARTAPAPDIPPLPGMCPHVVVKAGGGAGGGGGGRGAGAGGGGSGGGPGSGGDGAGGGSAGASEGAPDGKKGSASGAHPIDLITGALYTTPHADITLPAELELQWVRVYRTTNLRRSCGIGVGWWHSYGWRARISGGEVELIDGAGLASRVALPDEGADVAAPYGRRLSRRGKLLIITSTDGLQRTLAAHQCGWYVLVDVRDRADNAITVDYDAYGSVERIGDSVGRRVERRVDGRLLHWFAVASDAQGQEHRQHYVSYELDEHGDLITVTDAEGQSWRFRYDDAHYLIEETRPDGLITHFVFERQRTLAYRRCIETWSQSGQQDILRAIGRDEQPRVTPHGSRPKGIFHTTIRYGPDPYTSEVTEADGGTHHYFGNALGLVETYVDPRGHVTTLSYDDRGSVQSRAEGAGKPEQLEKTEDGLVLARTDALGNTTRITRDERGLPTAIEDARGARWEMEYDARGCMTLRREPGGRLTTMQYDARGRLIAVVEPDGTAVSRQYDAHDNLIAHRRGNAEWRYAYDLFGRLKAAVTPRGARWAFEHDKRGLLLAAVGPLGQQMRYQLDPLGRPQHITHPGGGVSRMRYAGDAVVERSYPDGSRMRLGYDALLRGIWAENGAGEHFLIERDPAGLPIWQRSFAGVQTHVRYDVERRPVFRQRHDGTTIEYAYDEAGRLAAASYHDGTHDELSYDEAGRLIGVKSGSTEVRYQLDEAGRIRREEQHAPDWRFAVDYERDAIGRVTHTRCSTGWEIRRHYLEGDIGEQLRIIEDGSEVDGIDLAYDAAGESLSWQRPDRGDQISVERDELGRTVKTQVWQRGELARERSYAWSERAGIESVGDERGGAVRYELDVLGRVVHEQREDDTQRTSYSAHGTPLPQSGQTRTGADGRVIGNADATYRWDDLGRLIAIHPHEADGVSWTLHYDGRDRLIELKGSDGRVIRHIYDGLGRRLASTDGHTTSWFGWLGDAPAEERHSSGAFTRRIFAEDGFTPLLERNGQDGWALTACDAASTPWLWLNRDGRLGEMALDSRGRVQHRDCVDSRMRFAGQRADDAAGLVYQRFRYYLPAIGQFITPDPLSLWGSVQDVGFVSNPTAYIDPLGLVVVCMTDDPWAVGASKKRAQHLGQPWVHGRELGAGTKSLAGHNHVEICTHGKPGQAQIGKGYASGTTMGKLLKGSGFKGKSVNLTVCNGATPPQGGGNSFAQDLANETGANVTGANGGLVYNYNDPALAGQGFIGVPHPDSTDCNPKPPIKCGTWDTVGPQTGVSTPHTLPPPGPRVPPGYDPSQVKPGWTY